MLSEHILISNHANGPGCNRDYFQSNQSQSITIVILFIRYRNRAFDKCS